jgi:hypothetical protein
MPPWLTAFLPAWAERTLGWLLHPAALSALAVGSVTLFLATTVGVPLLVARLPADYFSRRERDRYGMSRPPQSRWKIVARVAKNVVGWVLLAAGLAMLVLPGQGLLTIVVALLLVDFPGKPALQRRLIASRRVLDGVNRLRRRAGQPPMLREELLRKDRADDR